MRAGLATPSRGRGYDDVLKKAWLLADTGRRYQSSAEMDDWVLDSLVGFLKSSTWSCPINSFTDKHCVVFDPGEENKFSYTDIHREYQKLVEDTLESFTSDLGISGEQFTHACSQLQTSKAGQENEELFEQVLAADDFLLFKANMVRRNIDLELQALSLMKRQMGLSPSAYDKEREERERTTGGRNVKDDEKDLEEAVRMSEAQYKLECSMDNEELQRLIEQAKKESLQLYQQQQKTKGAEQRENGEGGGEEASAASVVADLKNTVEVGKTEEISKEEARPAVSPESSVEQTAPSVSSQPSSGSGDRAASQLGTIQTGSHTEGSSQLRAIASTIDSQTSQMGKSQPASQTVGGSQPGMSQMATQTVGDLPPLTRLTQPLPGLGASVETGSGDDAMARWLEGATSDTDSDSTMAANTASNSPAAIQLSSGRQGPTPEQLKAREMYLKRQRDHLLEMKKQQRAQALHLPTASSGGSMQPRAAPETQDSAETTGTGAGGGRGERRGRDTGVLSSAIAGNLKKS